jgi:hypothetical protein
VNVSLGRSSLEGRFYGKIEPIYAWVTEEFDTADLMEVKALLDELS